MSGTSTRGSAAPAPAATAPDTAIAAPRSAAGSRSTGAAARPTRRAITRAAARPCAGGSRAAGSRRASGRRPCGTRARSGGIARGAAYGLNARRVGPGRCRPGVRPRTPRAIAGVPTVAALVLAFGPRRDAPDLRLDLLGSSTGIADRGRRPQFGPLRGDRRPRFGPGERERDDGDGDHTSDGRKGREPTESAATRPPVNGPLGSTLATPTRPPGPHTGQPGREPSARSRDPLPDRASAARRFSRRNRGGAAWRCPPLGGDGRRPGPREGRPRYRGIRPRS